MDESAQAVLDMIRDMFSEENMRKEIGDRGVSAEDLFSAVHNLTPEQSENVLTELMEMLSNE